MKYVCVASENRSYFRWFLQSCRDNGIHPDVLGWNKPWTGFGTKISLIQGYIDSLHPETLVCCSDAYDVIVLRDERSFIETYEKITARENKKIVIGTDNHIQPKAMRFFTWLTFGKCGADYLNAGTWMGPAGLLSEIFKSYSDRKYSSDDQLFFVDVCKKYPDTIYVDKDCELFLTAIVPMGYVEEMPGLTVGGGNIRYNGTEPCILHAPMHGDLNNILIKLGYEVTDAEANKIKEERKRYYKKSAVHWAKLSINKIVIVILLLVVAVILIKAVRRASLKKIATRHK